MVWLGSVGSGAVVSSIGLVGFVDLVGWGGVVCLCGMVVLLFGLVRLLCPVGRFPMVTVVGSVGLVGLLGAVGLVGLRCSVCGGREKGEGGEGGEEGTARSEGGACPSSLHNFTGGGRGAAFVILREGRGGPQRLPRAPKGPPGLRSPKMDYFVITPQVGPQGFWRPCKCNFWDAGGGGVV